jgi:preprotein translocase subunit SecG
MLVGGTESEGSRAHGWSRTTLKRITMVAATAFLSLNIWTGAPLLALWVGARVSGQTVLSMKAVFTVVIVLSVLVFVMGMALAWLNNRYDELIERGQSEQRSPWLRSMRAEAEGHVSARVGITALERVVMASVYLAVLTLLVWFAFFSGPPLPSQ